MIPEDKAFKLISIYSYICDMYDKKLKYLCQRYSNNSNVVFTDQEIMTIYLFAVSQQNYVEIKDIHRFTKEYLLSWFPKLPSYQAFNDRLNNLSETFKGLMEHLLVKFLPTDCNLNVYLTDLFPIITCKDRNRKGKVAPEITDKGYYPTKEMYYHGIKLHAVSFKRPSRIPFPERIAITPASVNDLTAFRPGQNH
jgi:hypothetical protein